MRDKDFRELQLSSTQLVIIFLAILILGVVIFLLGVSVGKKQAQILGESAIASKPDMEQVKEKTLPPVKEPKNAISKELASHQKIKEKKQKPTIVAEKKNLYYVQVGAFKDKRAAFSFVEPFKKKGYPYLVLDPLPSDNNPVFRVRIGGYKTREKAEEVRARLRAEAKEKVDYFIVES